MCSSVPAEPSREQLELRVRELQDEFAVGERRLRGLEQEQAQLRDTLLRISGAIHVLQELLGSTPAD
jgi:hypothetical protein